MKWITFPGREFESELDFQDCAVPVSRIYGIQKHGDGAVMQLLPGNPGADSIRMETTMDFASLLGLVS